MTLESRMERQDKTGLLLSAFSLLTPRQRLGAFGCLIVFLAASALEMIGLSSTMPLVSVLVGGADSGGHLLAFISKCFGSPPPTELPFWLAGAAAMLMLTGAAAGLGAMTLMEWYGVRIAAYLSDRMVRDALGARYQWFLDQQAPKLAQRFVQDPMTVGLALYPPIMEVVYNTLFLLFATATVVATSPVYSLIVIGAVLLAAAIVLAVLRPMTARFAAEQRDLLMEANKIGVEAISGIKDVKVKGRAGYFAGLHNVAVRSASLARMKLNLVNRSVPSLILLVGQMGVLALAISLLASGASAAELTAQLTLLALVLARAIPAASRLFGSVNKLAGAEPFLRSMLALRSEVAMPDEPVSNDLPAAPSAWQAMDFRNVTYTYPRADHGALNGLSLRIERGGFYGVVGPSGAGKTTFVDLALRLLVPQSGDVLLDGIALSAYEPKSWYRRVGYVPQSPFISSDSLRRNVAFGIRDDRIDDDSVWRALEMAGLGTVCRALPKQLDTAMGDRGIRLSGGQRQRLAIARALYDAPELLILDEATSALDFVTEQEVQAAIASLRGRLTVIAIAHRLSTLETCDRIFVLDHGSLVAQGRHVELLASSGLYSRLAGPRQDAAAA